MLISSGTWAQHVIFCFIKGIIFWLVTVGNLYIFLNTSLCCHKCVLVNDFNYLCMLFLWTSIKGIFFVVVVRSISNCARCHSALRRWLWKWKKKCGSHHPILRHMDNYWRVAGQYRGWHAVASTIASVLIFYPHLSILDTMGKEVCHQVSGPTSLTCRVYHSV